MAGGANLPHGHAPGAAARRLGPEELLLAALVVLSLVGVAVTDLSERWGLRYWLAMAPVFGAISIAGSWTRARQHGETAAAIVRRQVLHWGALVLAVGLVYLFARTGQVTDEAAGLVALLALALTTLLAGVHFDWRLAVLGGALGLVAACAALIDSFFWIFLIPAVAAGALVLRGRRRAGRAA